MAKKASMTPEEQEISRRQERLKYKKHLQNLSDVVNLPGRSGLDFLSELSNHCFAYSTSFTGNSGTFFNEGMRNIHLKLIEWLRDAVNEGLIDKADLVDLMLSNINSEEVE